MNEISGMELNTKSPFLWDWDNLVPKKLQLVDSEFESIEGFGINGGSGSDLGYGSSSKSTISASVDSKFTLDSSGVDFSQDPTTTPSVPDVSIVSGDSLIGLKLGKRTYFEDVSVPNSSFPTGKRSKLLASQTAEIPHCQVEGCNLDLSSAKDYHRKHRVCVTHSKCSKVVICGVERRFCQQCSRFHSLSEFDQKKRSCRKRLSDHNARRRKPKPEILQFSSMSLPSPLHEGRNEISLAFNQVPMVQTRPNSNATWDFTSNSKVKQEQLGLFSPKRTQGIDNTPHITRNEPQETGFKLSYDSKQFAPSSDTITEVYHQGYQAMTATNNMNTAPELRALSLLSTNSWGSCSQEPTPPARPQPLDESSLLAIPASYWPGEAVSSSSSLQVPIIQKNGNTNPSQEFQLFKPANQSGFYAYQGLG